MKTARRHRVFVTGTQDENSIVHNVDPFPLEVLLAGRRGKVCALLVPCRGAPHHRAATEFSIRSYASVGYIDTVFAFYSIHRRIRHIFIAHEC